ncbi:hypothetical protein MAC_00814 [Metarhizium acridum CQMa 102]|uniref:Fasciclin domain family protein n=1 Tax=Metarhizium acridum (strain CQMa 102) TaxID=655827 RepID=E9DTH6_METAQ|nr:uncharacterized protein MAC_00814 [Metarhizium acridum CQMa 102]EFY93031.1 hypothetical protein MAC_00814 [Metarhizium acridum CQMa 102]
MDRPQPQPFPLAPVAASILAERETERRNHLRQLGYFKTSCSEIDDYVLLGGLERGHVVGLSAEEESFGIARALVITPKPAGVILRSLRDGIAAELAREGVVAKEDVERRARTSLDCVMLSCVFDMDGLWEVLAELDGKGGRASGRGPSPPVSEIQDSEDEGPSPPDAGAESPSPPSVVLVTHFSSLLTSLFARRAGPAAHANLSLLSSRLRHLSRSLPSSPLILILNSTTSSAHSHGPEPSRHRPYPAAAGSKPLDPSLRSIFNPPPLPIPGYVPTSSRRNKPSFGLVFTQLLDLHLLASRIPRTAEDAEVALGSTALEARFVTVVEVLLDEMGLWTGRTGRRPNREQRWAAVQVDGGRVVDAFEKQEMAAVTEIRTSGGFGGRRP